MSGWGAAGTAVVSAGVRVEHDVDVARDLVPHDAELHPGGDVGDHLGFEQHGEAGIRGNGQGVCLG